MLYLPRYNAVRPLLTDVNTLNASIERVRESAASDTGDKEFHIIARQASGVGLFTYVSYFLSGSLYALAKGMIPVFDMQSIPSIYLPEDKCGQENSWEYYFKQPFGYSVDDVLKGGYKYSRCHPTVAIKHVLDLPPAYKCGQKGLSPLWLSLYKNLLQLSDGAEQYIEEEYSRIIKPGMRVLGVYCRGTDYTWSRPKNHPVQPEVVDVIDKVKNVIEEWRCDYVYVTSEEQRIVAQFEEAFSGKVLTVSQRYYDNVDIDFSKHRIGLASFDRENDAYLKGLEYLTSVAVFSRCTSAVMGVCTGSVCALYLNGGRFENTYVFDLGMY